jgi:hypothetical protein
MAADLRWARHDRLGSSSGLKGRLPIGALYVLAAGLTWSFAGIFLRLAPDLNSWQFLSWRSLGVACALPSSCALRAAAAVVGGAIILAAVVWMAATGAGPPMARAAK